MQKVLTRSLYTGNHVSRPHVLGLALTCALIVFSFERQALGDDPPADQPAEAKHATTKTNRFDFATRIKPLLSQKCGSCHSGDRAKADLALDKTESIKEGGKSGPVLVAGKPEESLLIRRLRMPTSERGHMPPANKPQLTQEQIKMIEAWVAAGASFEAAAPSPDEPSAKPTKPTPAKPKPAPEHKPQPPAPPKVEPTPAAAKEAPSAAAANTPAQPAVALDNPPPANATAIMALRDHLVYVESLAQGSNRIRLDFAAAAKRTKDANAAKLIEPVLTQLDGISLARCGIGDETVALLAKAPRLQRVDLRNTQITDASLASLANVATLRELVLTQTHLTDASVEHLLAMTALERVYLWRSGLTAAGIARVRKERPNLHVEFGDTEEAKAKEVEPSFKLTGEAPPPVVVASTEPPTATTAATPKAADAAGSPPPQMQPAVAAASAPAKGELLLAIKPINADCPISGQPINAEYAVFFHGRAIGFCCSKCAAKFWEEPAKYEAKVLAAVQ